MQSPWIHQLRRERPIATLSQNEDTDVAVIGGGIAGVVTTYFLLRDTNLSVALIEGDKIGHGATGHNAGQVTSYFERPFSELVEEFGLELAADGQKSIEHAWTFLETIIEETELRTPLWQVTGYAGLSSIDLIIEHLENNALKEKAGIVPESFSISEEVDTDRIPAIYRHLYSVLPQKDILALLETENKEYIAALTARKGCINSALFCEELVGYMLNTYAERFTLAEQTLVTTIELRKNTVSAKTKDHTIESQHIVLCTNGFENITIFNEEKKDVDAHFHNMIHGTVGYMMGYLDPLNTAPSVISYLQNAEHGESNNHKTADPDIYYYLTRRPFENEDSVIHNLISIGGPEMQLAQNASYSRSLPHPEQMNQEIIDFIHHTYKPAPKKIEPRFRWHGLMGYTPNSVRRVGPEPRNPLLLYNIGCNGVGILSSIFGGHKIMQHIRGDVMKPSIFDIPKE